MTDKSTAAIYDENASNWSREQRILLSDFTARPRVIEELEPAKMRVLDLGCGEGYVARLAAAAGAVSIVGLDSSSEMVAKARAAIPVNTSCRMRFETADAAKLAIPQNADNDRAMAVFLFNYLTRAEMEHVMKVVRRSVVPGGRFIFTVPHPCFPYMRRMLSLNFDERAPFYFDTNYHDYFTGVDHTYEGQIWRRDGVAVPVRCVHKTLTDYFVALTNAGFTSMPKVEELHVTDEHLAIDPAFFGPLKGYPLHVLFRVEVP